jgi:hypothetical protein
MPLAQRKLLMPTMTTQAKTRLAESGRGRIVLHLIALSRGRHLRWHLAGVLRELLWR